MNFIEKRPILRQHDQNGFTLCGKHPHRCFVRAFVTVRCQNFEGQLVILSCLIRFIVHDLIESERVTPIKSRITVFFFIKEPVKNQLRNLRGNLAGIDRLVLDGKVDFLFLIGQENIKIAVLLHQRLSNQAFQGFIDFGGHFHAVIFYVRNHQTGDVFDIRFDFLDVFNHKQRF